MSGLNLDFYINKHRKAYEERLRKEQSNQENLKDIETKDVIRARQRANHRRLRL